MNPLFRSLSRLTLIPLVLSLVTTLTAQQQGPANMLWEGEHMIDLGPPVIPWLTGNGSTDGFGPGPPGWTGPRSHWVGRPIVGLGPDSIFPGVVETQGPMSGDSMSFDGLWVDIHYNGRADPGMHAIQVATHTGMGSVSMGIFATFTGGLIDSNVSIGIGNQDDRLGRRGPVGDFLPTIIAGTTLRAPFISIGTVSSTIELNGTTLEATTEIDLNGLNHGLHPRPGGQLPELIIAGSFVRAVSGASAILGIGTSAGAWELNVTGSVLEADKVLIGPTTGELALDLRGDAESFITAPMVHFAPAAGTIARVNVHGPAPQFGPESVVHIGERGRAILNLENEATFNTATTYAGLFDTSAAEINIDHATWTTKDMFLGFEGAVTVHAGNESKLVSNFVVIGQSASPQTAHVTLDNGSTWNTTGYLRVGWSGTGRLDVHGGSTVEAMQEIVLGVEQDSRGLIEVEGVESSLQTHTTFEVGRHGMGELHIREGGHVESVGNFFVGSYASGAGEVVVDGEGSQLEVTGGGLYVGFEGAGEVRLEDGGAMEVPSGGAILAAQVGSSGKLVVAGEGARFEQSGGDLVVGEEGEGEITLENGGAIEILGANVILAEQPGSSGTLVLEGPAAEFGQLDGNLAVAQAGEGSLEILGGSSMETAGNVVIAQLAGSEGDALVTDGGHWDIGGTLTVSREGEGRLTIAGGMVESGTAFIGSDPDAAGGEVLVSASTWEIRQSGLAGGSLFVGGGATSEGGPGELTIQSNGIVEVHNRVQVWAGGTIELEDGTLAAAEVNVLGRLEGEGAVEASIVTSSGFVIPGGDDAAGMLELAGDFTQLEDGSLLIELGGTAEDEHDHLAIEGVARLGGLLSVGFIESEGMEYHPQDGDEFVILEAESGVDDQFDLVNLPALPGGLSWDVHYAAHDVVLQILADFLAGDYDHTGRVDQGDLDLVLLNWGADAAAVGGDWVNGVVDQEELDGVLLNWGNSSALATTSVPEPATIALVLAGSLFGTLVCRARRIRDNSNSDGDWLNFAESSEQFVHVPFS